MCAESAVLEKNLRVLARRWTYIADRVSQADAGALNNSALNFMAGGEAAESRYGGLAAARNGMSVPSLTNGRAVHSLYDPIKEGQSIAKTLKPGYVLFAGLGGGHHVRAYLADNRRCAVMIAESDWASCKTLFSQCDYTDILSDERVSFSLFSDAERALPSQYFPALHGPFTLFPLRAWAEFDAGWYAAASEGVGRAIQAISRDYSVQSHFGKIWHRNILRNLAAAADQRECRFTFPVDKIAAVIGAGPSADSSLERIETNRGAYYVIATDTALRILSKRKIEPDAFVTIDGQNVSYLHFMNGLPEKTLAVIDLCAHPAAAQAARGDILFTASAHPLARLADSYRREAAGCPPFPFIETGSGTVTLAAADFALKAGFERIELHGADFAFTGGKPYARGTYLEDRYFTGQDRFAGLEELYSALMFRTPVLRLAGADGAEICTTATLESYARQAEAFACRSRAQITRAVNAGYPLVMEGAAESRRETAGIERGRFSFPDFAFWYRNALEKLAKTNVTGESPGDIEFSLLPLAAWAAKMGIREPGEGAFSIAVNLALRAMGRYTVGYHE